MATDGPTVFPSNGAGNSTDAAGRVRGTRDWAIAKLMEIIEAPINPRTITAADRSAAVSLVGELGTRDWLIAKLTGLIATPIDPNSITAADRAAAIEILGKLEGWLPQQKSTSIEADRREGRHRECPSQLCRKHEEAKIATTGIPAEEAA
jgi:hypothetical protein